MILDRLDSFGRYVGLHPHFEKVQEFLEGNRLEDLPLGKHEIDGEKVFAIVGKDAARARGDAKLEAHRRYIDIQIVLGGTDEMGWKNCSLCELPVEDYDPDKDFILYEDAPDAWVAVASGAMAVFFPEDAHAPLVGEGRLHKVVIKVAV